MTKMQAIARTILTVLGVYAVVTLLGAYPGRYFFSGSPPTLSAAVLEVIFFLAFIGLAGLLACAAIVNNGPLARAITDDEGTGTPAESAFLAQSLRIGLVLAGLMLLPGSVPFLLKVLTLPFVLRPVVNEWIVSGVLPSVLRVPWARWYTTGFELLRAVLMIYLVAGAPRFVRLQVRHTCIPTLDGGRDRSSVPEVQP